MEKEYRIIDYSQKWYLERLKSTGVWDILGVYQSKQEAEEALRKEKNG